MAQRKSSSNGQVRKLVFQQWQKIASLSTCLSQIGPKRMRSWRHLRVVVLPTLIDRFTKIQRKIQKIATMRRHSRYQAERNRCWPWTQTYAKSTARKKSTDFRNSLMNKAICHTSRRWRLEVAPKSDTVRLKKYFEGWEAAKIQTNSIKSQQVTTCTSQAWNIKPQTMKVSKALVFTINNNSANDRTCFTQDLVRQGHITTQ